MRQLFNSDVVHYAARAAGDMCTGALSRSSTAAADIGSAFLSNSPQMPGVVFSAVHCSRVQSWLSYTKNRKLGYTVVHVM